MTTGIETHPRAELAPVLPSQTEAPARRWLRSEQLLGNASEVEIHHGASVYRLRQTAQGKLILTK